MHVVISRKNFPSRKNSIKNTVQIYSIFSANKYIKYGTKVPQEKECIMNNRGEKTQSGVFD